jgi:hypothetical protein
VAGAKEVAERIRAEVGRREITRLCHLTPFRNLLHIAGGKGLLSISDLNADERAVFDQQDLERYDNRPEHISCSVEYPNVWYLRQRRSSATPEQKLFPDWVCLLIDPRYIWHAATEFCPRNAAAGHGVYLKGGYDAFTSLFAERVAGAGGSERGRNDKPDSCPTDDQAEVMVHKHIPLAHANRVVVADKAQANRVFVGLRLAMAPVTELTFVIAPVFFETRLSQVLRGGKRPVETPWDPPNIDAAA